MHRSSRHTPWSRLALSACVALVLLPATPVHAQSDNHDKKALMAAPREATPLTIVAPEFPAGATAPPAGIRVDVEGTVLADGSFRANAVRADGDHPRFVSAVADVLSWWRFEPAVDDGPCVPVDSPSRMAVWFEGSAEAPRISVSRPRKEPDKGAPPFEYVSSPKVEYPIPLVDKGIEGIVKVLVLVTPSGSVQSAKIRSASLIGAFENASLRAASRLQVAWKKPAPTANVCMVREYVFCLEGVTPNLAHPACKLVR